MPIETVYIATYKHDFRLTRIAVASIRYWHPTVDICLIKDHGAGAFNTKELEQRWNVRVFATQQQRFGWGFSKLEPLFIESRTKFLVLDSDTVFVGPVLDALNAIESDFIVDDETQPEKDITRLYFDVTALAQIDAGFRPCGKNFNSGQWVGTSKVLSRDDFADVVEWSEPPRLKYQQVFMPGEQGVLNYVLENSANLARCTLARTRLMLWAGRDTGDLDLALIKRQSPYHQIIHWAGCKLYGSKPLPRFDILEFFENQYYSRIPGGLLLRKWRILADFAGYQLRRVRQRIKI